VLGLALLAAPAGLVVVVPFAGRIMHLVGSRRPTLIAGTCAPLIPVALGLAPNLAALMAALFGFGLAGGMLDVGMNSQAVLVERGARRPLMTSFHACYSFGGLTSRRWACRWYSSPCWPVPGSYPTSQGTGSARRPSP
jgi:MFS family permease